MKVSATSRTIIAIVVLLVLAVVFWTSLLSPKRKESDELAIQVEQLQTTLTETRSTIATGEQARREFPRNYQQLVVLGKAVPGSDESASLLIALNHISKRADVKFESLLVGAADGGGAESAEPAPEVAPEAAPSEEQPEGETEGSTGVPTAAAVPTEAAAATVPIGAVIGPAGLSVLPYDLTFEGSFFDVADFISGIDGLIDTGKRTVAVDGRLITIDGFALSASAGQGFKKLNANFSVTTFLVPPGQGVTAGATPTEPAPVEASPTSSTSGSELR